MPRLLTDRLYANADEVVREHPDVADVGVGPLAELARSAA